MIDILNFIVQNVIQNIILMNNKTGRKKLPDIEKMPKIGISISRENYDHLKKEDELRSRIINRLLTKYFKNKYKKV